jgi:hypothetical protein
VPNERSATVARQRLEALAPPFAVTENWQALVGMTSPAADCTSEGDGRTGMIAVLPCAVREAAGPFRAGL